MVAEVVIGKRAGKLVSATRWWRFKHLRITLLFTDEVLYYFSIQKAPETLDETVIEPQLFLTPKHKCYYYPEL